MSGQEPSRSETVAPGSEELHPSTQLPAEPITPSAACRRQGRPFGITLPVLTYHDLDDCASPVATSPAQFRRQMAYLSHQGWRTLSLDQFLQGHARGCWPTRTFVLTFDDGLESFASHALPVLREYSFSATVFVVAEWVGLTNDWPGQPNWVRRQKVMSWDTLCGLVEAGMEVGAHTASHPRLTRLTLEAQRREMSVCDEAIQSRLGRPVRAFAYPYGDLSTHLEGLVAAHYEAGFSTRLGYVTPRSRSAAFERIDTFYLRNPYLFKAFVRGGLNSYLAVRRALRALWERAGR